MNGDQILARARSLWPAYSVPYNMEAMRDGYRTDCSGFVSMVLGIPASGDGRWGGESTITLPRWLDPIDVNDLQPGDIIGCLGPGTGGADGHVVIFEKWLNDDPGDDRYYCFEQSGDGPGPRHSVRTYPYDGLANYRAWRPKNKTTSGTPDGNDDMTPDQAQKLVDVWAWLAQIISDEGVSKRPEDRFKFDNPLHGLGKRLERVEQKLTELAADPPHITVKLDPDDRAAIVAEVTAALRSQND